MDIRNFFSAKAKAEVPESIKKKLKKSNDVPVVNDKAKGVTPKRQKVQATPPKRDIKQKAVLPKPKVVVEKISSPESDSPIPTRTSARKHIVISDDDEDGISEDEFEPDLSSSEGSDSSSFESEVIVNHKKRKSPAIEKMTLKTDDAKHAKSYVEKSAKKLKIVEKTPEKVKVTKKKLETEEIALRNSTNRKARAQPAKDSKELEPKSSGLCFEGQSFALTGVLNSINREEAEDLIKQNGGKVTTSVSGKTNFLLYGNVLEDGRPVHESRKYITAKSKGTIMLSEEDFLNRIPKTSLAEKSCTLPAISPPSEPVSVLNGNVKPEIRQVSGIGRRAEELWVDKYSPKLTSDLIGHAGEVKKLADWLQNWDKRGKKGEMSQNAVLISGPPGIGKTSAAVIVSKALGFSITEYNASDARNKKALDDSLKEVLSSTVLAFGTGRKSCKRLVIMDEVDGMGAGDRGGMAELIKLIKSTRVPIICICNDRQDPKVRSLASHCLDLKFRRPNKMTIAKRMKEIARCEGLDIDLNAAEMLSESVGNDIRQVLNAMQMWSRGSNTMGYMQVKGGMDSINKDKSQRVSAFDGTKMILSNSKAFSQAERYEAFFTDYSLVPLMVQQNWPDAISKSNKSTMMERMARAADAISDAELVGSMVQGDTMRWELLPLYAAMHLRVGFECQGYIGFPGFPQWLGKYSATAKRKRLLAELSTHMNARINGDRNAVRLEYLPSLQLVLSAPLRHKGIDGVNETVDLLDDYGLSRDDLIESMGEFTMKGVRDCIGEIPGPVKSALTRAYNQGTHSSQALVTALSAPQKVKASKRIPKSVDMDEDDEEIAALLMDDDEEDEEEEENDVSAFIKKPRGKPATNSQPAAVKSNTKAKTNSTQKSKKGR